MSRGETSEPQHNVHNVQTASFLSFPWGEGEEVMWGSVV